MKKTVKTLRFTRESLRLITPVEVGHGAGGPANTDLQNSCGSVCYTDKTCGGSVVLTGSGGA